jgi:hypothetical protein
VRCVGPRTKPPLTDNTAISSRPNTTRTTIDPTDKTLIIDGLRVSDQGVYICEGENAVGSAKAMAQVSVNCK